MYRLQAPDWVSNFITILMIVFFALFGNALYRHFTYEKVQDIQLSMVSSNVKSTLQKQGGTNMFAAIMWVILLLLFMIAVVRVMTESI